MMVMLEMLGIQLQKTKMLQGSQLSELRVALQMATQGRIACFRHSLSEMQLTSCWYAEAWDDGRVASTAMPGRRG